MSITNDMNEAPLVEKRRKPTIKDLMLTDQLVKGKVLLDKKVAAQKVMEEAIEFEMRNRQQKVRR